MEIDATGLSYEALGARIRSAAAGEEVTVNNLLGQRYIASGLSGGRLVLKGTPGNALGAYLGESSIRVEGNAQDAVGDTMNAGEIIIRGHAGDTVGYAMRGGLILIRDYAGFRVGIHMKEYGSDIPRIVVGGTAGDFLGEYMAGGVIVVLGIGAEDVCPVGAFCATGQYGGKIYIRTEHPPVGLPPQVTVTAHADPAPILPLIERYCSEFGENKSNLARDKNNSADKNNLPCNKGNSFDKNNFAFDKDKLARDNFVLLTPSTANIYKRLYCNRPF